MQSYTNPDMKCSHTNPELNGYLKFFYRDDSDESPATGSNKNDFPMIITGV